MFNNNKERDNMNNPKNIVFLVIKKTTWNDGETWFDVSENSKTKERAQQCVVALNTLNDDKKISYLISEVAND
jgi:hypothetical protein